MNLHEIVVIPPNQAVLCAGCGAVSNSANDMCPACASRGCLMSISGIVNRVSRSAHTRTVQVAPIHGAGREV